MLLAKSIFPIWCVLANSMHSTKVDMLIRDIFIMTSAIIISTMDIQRVHTNNIANMLIIQRFSIKQFIVFESLMILPLFRTRRILLMWRVIKFLCL